MADTWLTQELLGLKPEWLLDEMLYPKKYENVLLQIIRSKTLLQVGSGRNRDRSIVINTLILVCLWIGRTFTFLHSFWKMSCVKQQIWSHLLRIWLHFLKKTLMENFIFCALCPFWYPNDSVAKLMISIRSGVSLWYRPCYKNMLNYDKDNNIWKLTTI